MNTTHAATRQPSSDPFARVTISAMAERHPFGSILGSFACQAITQSGKACTHQAVTKAWGRGPRKSATILLCKTHGNARYTIDADPSL